MAPFVTFSVTFDNVNRRLRIWHRKVWGFDSPSSHRLEERILPTHYFHVVFTLRSTHAPWLARHLQTTIYWLPFAREEKVSQVCYGKSRRPKIAPTTGRAENP